MTTPIATRVRIHVIDVAIENAAPGLRTIVNVTTSPMISIGCPGLTAATAHTFVRMSESRMTAAMAMSMVSRRGFSTGATARSPSSDFTASGFTVSGSSAFEISVIG